MQIPLKLPLKVPLKNRRLQRRPFDDRRSKRLIALCVFALVLGSLLVPDATARSSQCAAVRAVFYTSNDWWRLAQGLAADPSSCAQYYISIAPASGDKTAMRPDAAPRVDALGANFHSLAEVNYTAWQNWVASTGNSWYQAGQAARSSMDAAGFNIAAGDTWAVNEFPSSVLTDADGSRQNAEQLVQGLDAGDGSDAPAQGVVFMVGVGQNGVSLPQYKASLESWFQDSAFWSTMSSDVSDFFYEAYGDVADYAVAGEDPATRIDYLNAFLQAPLDLVTAPGAPESALPARSFLASAYGPLANASWAWSSDYGSTAVGSEVMADFISAQTYAMRSVDSDSRIGFAWNPSNGEGLPRADYEGDVAGILARLAGSIHETDGGDPAQACEATGCSAVIGGGPPATGWSTFSTWTPTVAAFTSAPQTAAPGAASGPLSVELETGGVATMLPIASSLVVSSSSPSGAFASDPGGPWTPTLTLTLPPGEDTASFYTLDPTAGSPTITANLDGQLSTQTETIPAPPPPPPPPPTTVTTPPPPPPAAELAAVTFSPAGDRMHVAVRVVDDGGQPLQAQVQLALLVGSSILAESSGATSADGWLAITAGQPLERGCYRVQVQSLTVPGYAWNGASPPQTDCVSSLPARVSSLVFTPEQDRMHVALRVVDDAGQPLRAEVRLLLLVGSSVVTDSGGTTAADGSLGITALPRLARGCYRARVESVTAPGYSWDRAEPAQSYCVSSLPARVGSVTLTRVHHRLHAELRVVDDAGRPVRARVAFSILHGTATFAATAGTTSSAGGIGLTAYAQPEPGCYLVHVQSVTAPGYTWDGLAPGAATCVPHVPPARPRARARGHRRRRKGAAHPPAASRRGARRSTRAR